MWANNFSGGNAQKDREREREIRAEEKRRRDAAEREKQRQHDPNKPNDPKGGPSKSSQGIRDKDPYGLPDPLGEKPIPGGARPEPWVVVNVNIVIVRGLPFL